MLAFQGRLHNLYHWTKHDIIVYEIGISVRFIFLYLKVGLQTGDIRGEWTGCCVSGFFRLFVCFLSRVVDDWERGSRVTE